MKRKRTLLLVGVGDLGYGMLRSLLRRSEIERIIAADKDVERAESRVNTALLSAIQDGYSPDVEFARINLLDVEATAERMKEIAPEMIFASPTLMSWTVYSGFGRQPEEFVTKLQQTRPGGWLPMHLSLVMKLMQAVKKSGLKVGRDLHVVTSPYPDAVNVVLGKMGMAPTTGVGNIAEMIPQVRLLVSRRLHVPLSNTRVYAVAHHSVGWAACGFGNLAQIPFLLRILVGDKVIPQNVLDPREILAATFPTAQGTESHPLTVTVSMPVVMSIWNDTGEICHAPGPDGLPGGYPVRGTAEGVEVFLPEGVTMEEAKRINEEAGKADGIERISEDGTVFMTEEVVRGMRDAIGYDAKPIRPGEVDERAREIGAAYKRTLSEKYGYEE